MDKAAIRDLELAEKKFRESIAKLPVENSEKEKVLEALDKLSKILH